MSWVLRVVFGLIVQLGVSCGVVPTPPSPPPPYIVVIGSGSPEVNSIYKLQHSSSVYRAIKEHIVLSSATVGQRRVWEISATKSSFLYYSAISDLTDATVPSTGWETGFAGEDPPPTVHEYKGQCFANNTCVCSDNYYSAACDVYCTPEESCSGHGSCSAFSGACLCSAPFSGLRCASCAGHGEWSPSQRACDCVEDYEGPFCEKYSENFLAWFTTENSVALATGVILLLLVLAIVWRGWKYVKKRKDERALREALPPETWARIYARYGSTDTAGPNKPQIGRGRRSARPSPSYTRLHNSPSRIHSPSRSPVGSSWSNRSSRRSSAPSPVASGQSVGTAGSDISDGSDISEGSDPVPSLMLDPRSSRVLGSREIIGRTGVALNQVRRPTPTSSTVDGQRLTPDPGHSKHRRCGERAAAPRLIVRRSGLPRSPEPAQYGSNSWSTGITDSTLERRRGASGSTIVTPSYDSSRMDETFRAMEQQMRKAAAFKRTAAASPQELDAFEADLCTVDVNKLPAFLFQKPR